MSLSTAPQRFEIGVILSRNFDNQEVLNDTLAPHVANISHIHSNAPEPSGKFLEKFSRENGIALTIWPASPHTFVCINNILNFSKFVYIITDTDSAIGILARDECIKKKLKYKFIPYEPIGFWRDKVLKISEVVAKANATEGQETVKAIRKIINV